MMSSLGSLKLKSLGYMVYSVHGSDSKSLTHPA
jgi:hypothetical protein